MKQKLILTILLLGIVVSISYSNNSFGNYKLKFYTKEVKDNFVVAELKYEINLPASDNPALVYLKLPFLNNPALEFIVEPKSDNTLILNGFQFNDNKKGICQFLTRKSNTTIYLTYKNVKFPLQEIGKEEYSGAIILEFNEMLPELTPQITAHKILPFSDIKVYSDILFDSKPLFKRSEDNNNEHSISLSKKPNEEDKKIILYFGKEGQSFLPIFFLVIGLSFILGLFAAPTFFKKKNWSIGALITSTIILIIIIILFFKYVIPTQFKQDIDVISIIGSALGLFFGVFAFAIYNIINIYIIEKKQG